MILYYILVPFAWLLWHIGFRIHVEGRENLKKVQTKGYILAPTHVSAIDPVFIVVTRWGRRMVVFAKKGTVRDQRPAELVLPLLRRSVRARHPGRGGCH